MHLSPRPAVSPGHATRSSRVRAAGDLRQRSHATRAPSGVMIGTTAMARAMYGQGHVLLISPHPERSEGLDGVIRAAIAWITPPRRDNDAAFNGTIPSYSSIAYGKIRARSWKGDCGLHPRTIHAQLVTHRRPQPTESIQCVSIRSSSSRSPPFLLAASSASPLHLQQAELIAHQIDQSHNEYAHKDCFIHWKGEAGATTFENRTDCSDFLNLLLVHAYRLSDAQMEHWTSRSRPPRRDLVRA